MRYASRGEVWLIDLGMTAKVRPCLVVSTRIDDSDRALLCLVPHTTATRSTKFEAVVNPVFLKSGAFDAQGLVTVPARHVIRHSALSHQNRWRQSSERSVTGWSFRVANRPANKRLQPTQPAMKLFRVRYHSACGLRG